MNTDASILVYTFRPERTGFNMYTEYSQLQLTFLALHSCLNLGKFRIKFLYITFLFSSIPSNNIRVDYKIYHFSKQQKIERILMYLIFI